MIRRRAPGPVRTGSAAHRVGTRLGPGSGGRSGAVQHRSPARSARHADRLAVQVPAGATLALLLPEAEKLLLAVSAVEPRPGCRAGSDPLPLPLAGRLALAALYRVWDGIDHQLHPSLFPPGRSGDAEPAVQVVRLPASDLVILQAAAVALERPTPELAVVLTGVTSDRAVRALTALLRVLIPVPAGSVPAGGAAQAWDPRRHAVTGDHVHDREEPDDRS